MKQTTIASNLKKFVGVEVRVQYLGVLTQCLPTSSYYPQGFIYTPRGVYPLTYENTPCLCISSTPSSRIIILHFYSDF